MHSYDVVSDESVDRVCNANHRIGALNGKVVGFCADKAKSNRMENVKRVADTEVNDVEQAEEKKLDIENVDVDKDAKLVRAAIKSHLNEQGRIGLRGLD